MGKFFFSKYELPQNFISCESPLMLEPPGNFASNYSYMIKPRKNIRKSFKTPKVTRRMAFGVCHMIRAVNEAATFYKQHNCKDSNANFNKTFTFFDNMTMELMN